MKTGKNTANTQEQRSENSSAVQKKLLITENVSEIMLHEYNPAFIEFERIFYHQSNGR